MAIARIVAVVAEHKVFVRADFARLHRVRIRLRDIRLGEGHAVDEHPAALYFDRLARQADDALDELALAFALEHDDVAALGRLQAVHHPVDDDVFAVVQIRLHARAVNPKAACDGVDQDENDDGQQQRFDDFTKQRRALRRGRLRRVGFWLGRRQLWLFQTRYSSILDCLREIIPHL